MGSRSGATSSAPPRDDLSGFRRWMYWTDWEEDPKESKRGRIERAWMDGSNRNVFLSSKTVLWPNGLSLDIQQGVLYWVDAYYDRIEMVYLNSSERKVSALTAVAAWEWGGGGVEDFELNLCLCLLLQTVYEGQELNHAFGLCHYKHFLFWNEYRSGSIYKLDSTTGAVTLLRSERPPIFEIRMYDAHQQQGAPAPPPPPPPPPKKKNKSLFPPLARVSPHSPRGVLSVRPQAPTHVASTTAGAAASAW